MALYSLYQTRKSLSSQYICGEFSSLAVLAVVSQIAVSVHAQIIRTPYNHCLPRPALKLNFEKLTLTMLLSFVSTFDLDYTYIPQSAARLSHMYANVYNRSNHDNHDHHVPFVWFPCPRTGHASLLGTPSRADVYTPTQRQRVSGENNSQPFILLYLHSVIFTIFLCDLHFTARSKYNPHRGQGATLSTVATAPVQHQIQQLFASSRHCVHTRIPTNN